MLCVLLACDLGKANGRMAAHRLFPMAAAGARKGMLAQAGILGEAAHAARHDLYQRKERPVMMDCLMAGTLLVGFGLVWLLVNWCRRQVDSQE